MNTYINEEFDKIKTREELKVYANMTIPVDTEEVVTIVEGSHEVWKLIHYDEKPTNVDEYSKVEEVGYKVDTSDKVQRTYRVVDRGYTDEYIYKKKLSEVNEVCNHYLKEATSVEG